MIVTATQSFTHDGIRARRGQQLNIVSTQATKLRDAGLVSFNGLPGDPPLVPAGDTSSASQAGQAAPQTTSNESADGDSEKPKRKRKAKAAPEQTEADEPSS